MSLNIFMRNYIYGIYWSVNVQPKLQPTQILKIYANAKDKHSLEQSIKTLDFENEKNFEIEVTGSNTYEKNILDKEFNKV